MIKDLGESAPGLYDVCIVGSGPSGMTVAGELRGSGLKVCVLESGGLKPTRFGDALRRVKSEGIEIKDYSRERVVGGASTTWSGLSSPLDPIDFEERSYMARSGWPIARDELLPYYEAAARRYRFPPLDYFREGFAEVRQQGEGPLAWSEVEEKIFMAPGVAQNFGREFIGIFEEEGTDLFLDATVIRIEEEEALLRTSEGKETRCRARVFVLAAGGIENARLLLNSNLGNEHDQVGRCMMNHPKNDYGRIDLAKPVREMPYYFGYLYKGFAGYAGMKLNPAVQRKEGLLNTYVRFVPLYPWSGNQGVEAFVYLAMNSKILLKSWMRLKKGEVVPLRDYSETGDDTQLKNERKTALSWVGLCFKVLFNLPMVARYLYYRLLKREGPEVPAVLLRNFMEMEPHPENRVVLGDEKDAHGQPVPVVRHRLTDLDRRSLEYLHERLKQEFERNGFGRLESGLKGDADWPVNQDASHHMGTTRMGRDPKTSVVNPSCRLHAKENIYLAGGSVFPTSGCANPTFTMVALAIRLAGHLKKELGS
jgi:choline dehydrogenase-like flavoprotein